MQPPVVNIHPPSGNKMITLPDGRKAKIENVPEQN
jgi:alpha-ketoglutarate-dependent taurine dioxygenase